MKLDTLLNVFLAIAVDNLTNAEILSQDEEDEQKALARQRTARTGFTGPGLHWTKLKALSFVRTLQKQVAEDERRENPDQSVLANSSTSSNAGRIRKETQGIHDVRELVFSFLFIFKYLVLGGCSESYVCFTVGGGMLKTN